MERRKWEVLPPELIQRTVISLFHLSHNFSLSSSCFLFLLLPLHLPHSKWSQWQPHVNLVPHFLSLSLSILSFSFLFLSFYKFSSSFLPNGMEYSNVERKNQSDGWVDVFGWREERNKTSHKIVKKKEIVSPVKKKNEIKLFGSSQNRVSSQLERKI